MQMNRTQPAPLDHYQQQVTAPQATQPHLLTPESGTKSRESTIISGPEQMITDMDSDMSQTNQQALISTATMTNPMSDQTGASHISINELTNDTTNKMNMKINCDQMMMNTTNKDLCHEARLGFE